MGTRQKKTCPGKIRILYAGQEQERWVVGGRRGRKSATHTDPDWTP